MPGDSLHDPTPQRFSRDTYLCAEDRQVGYTSEYADMYDTENNRRKRAFDGNVRWCWGKDPIARGATTVRAYRGEDSSPEFSAWARTARPLAVVTSRSRRRRTTSKWQPLPWR